MLLACNRKELGAGKYGEKQQKSGLRRNSCVSYKIQLSPKGRVSIQDSVSQNQSGKAMGSMDDPVYEGRWPKECSRDFPEGAWLIFSSCHLILCFLQVFNEEVEWILRGFHCVCSTVLICGILGVYFRATGGVCMDHWELKFYKLYRWCWGRTDCDTLSSQDCCSRPPFGTWRPQHHIQVLGKGAGALSYFKRLKWRFIFYTQPDFPEVWFVCYVLRQFPE